MSLLVQQLPYLSDALLRRRVTAATNKVEVFNGFSQWVGFGNGGVITDKYLVEQEKATKFNALLTYDPHVDVDLSPLCDDGPPAAHGYGQAA
ncbi:Tn3 family transposase [Streptomyces sp. NPDC001635]|nr:hypothetical protein E4K10_46450 [Streptomyces sp. T1317-0309]